MAAPYNPPKKNEDFKLYIALTDATDGRSFKSTPTIASGDFKISKDGAAFTNIATSSGSSTYIAAATASGVLLELWISATDMNADNVVIVGIDQTTPKEWSDFILTIPTTA